MNKGMTLIEVIIAMAIFAIFSIAILSVFSYTIIGVYDFGRNTESIFENQDSIEGVISDGTSATSEGVTFVFKFSDGVTSGVTVTGETVTEGDLKIFMPAK